MTTPVLADTRDDVAHEGPCSHLIVTTGRECGAPGVLVSAMCEHEHSRTGYQCATHRARRDSNGCCRVCYALGHFCRMWWSR